MCERGGGGVVLQRDGDGADGAGATGEEGTGGRQTALKFGVNNLRLKMKCERMQVGAARGCRRSAAEGGRACESRGGASPCTLLPWSRVEGKS